MRFVLSALRLRLNVVRYATRAGKYCIANRKLYVLQAQANADAYDADDAVRSVLGGLVSSFKVTKS